MNGAISRVAITALLGFSVACSKEGGHGAASFDEALRTAAAMKKVVFAEFGATWCGPCKRLESTTLADPRVREWLDARCVSVHVDIDEQAALASEFSVASVPTMVFVKPDRSVLGTITGYRDADHFLAEAERRLAGISAASDAAEAVQKRPDDLVARMQYFDELANAGDHAAALEQGEYYWDKSRADPVQGGVRSTFFLASMGTLAKKYAPARAAMQRWAGEARQRLSSEDENERHLAAMEFAALTTHSGDTALLIRTAEELTDRSLQRALITIDKQPFLVAGRYQFLVDCGVCDPKKLGKRMEQLRKAKGAETNLGKGLRDIAQRDLEAACEALAGVGREDDALAVVAIAVDGEADAAAIRKRMAEAADRAHAAGLAVRIRRGS